MGSNNRNILITENNNEFASGKMSLQHMHSPTVYMIVFGVEHSQCRNIIECESIDTPLSVHATLLTVTCLLHLMK